MSCDLYGYYQLLEIGKDASPQEIRSAYRRLAKIYHPDSGYRDGGILFGRITAAYGILSDSAQRVKYDALNEDAEENRSDSKSNNPGNPGSEGRSRPVEPVRCEVCGQIAAQPRRLSFWRVTSFLVSTSKTPIQKIFCRDCAWATQWKATLWTGLLGWWGVPWGPIWATSHGLGNAFGGTREPKLDEALMHQNALAFATRGDGKMAVGLSNVLRKSSDPKMAGQAADIIRFFAEKGIDTATEIKDVWRQSIARTMLLAIAALGMPVTIIGLFIYSSSTQSSNPYVTPVASNEASPIQTEAAPSIKPQDAAASPVVAPKTCSHMPISGAAWHDTRPSDAHGHRLTIENGSDGDAIVKMRNSSGKIIVAFFVSQGATTEIDRIPDGDYRIQYAMGGILNKTCKQFVSPTYIRQFADMDHLETRTEEAFDGTSVIRSHLTYTLYQVPSGNIRPEPIDAAAFDAP